ncbi:FIST N-terminal domain-containing protein [uncultured Imperialibacter sp.]|uniref:FIST signal transduction protein n=1 Tax=uncultured Imperialibacter sp. TaxID=1672639 RepID=UPI0030D83519|tara:strand:- start:145462 stop:146604 length:1143 start_codon:yes stop_codon:yes gene_type:complete
MQTTQLIWKNDSWENYDTNENIDAQLVFFFGATKLIAQPKVYTRLKEKFPKAHILGCSTAGEIIEDEVLDGNVVATAIRFDKTTLDVAYEFIDNSEQSYSVGEKLGKTLNKQGLKSIFVLSDGLAVNGTDLIKGIGNQLPKDVIISGGLSGDGADFGRTLVACNDYALPGQIAAVGFYGNHIHIGQGSVGGWDSFGPDRLVTKSKSNILYELDGKPALDLYKKYLGEKAEELPSSALLFPLMIRPAHSEEEGIVRTILAVSEEDKSMTFAGDIPEGYMAKLMMSNFDRLIDGANEAASITESQNGDHENGESLAILISCVGRKLVLGHRIEEEVETVQSVFNKNTKQIGFYSYGEISSNVKTGLCELHNQTMTITLITEK